MSQAINQRIADEIDANKAQVDAAVELLDEGATVPFIARYRKEATNGLDDTQLRTLQERLAYLRELEERREVVLRSITEQNKLTADLEKNIKEALTKTQLEDLYRPYMPKRRTKAQIAKEAGLEPLALALLNDPTLSPDTEAEKFIKPDAGIADAQAALDGARQILMETFSDDAQLSNALREYLWQHSKLQSKVIKGKEKEAQKYADYFDRSELLISIPSHRALALFRGRSEKFLQLAITIDEAEEKDKPGQESITCENQIAQHFNIANKNQAADTWLLDTARWTWRVKLFTRLDTELKLRVKEAAEAEAIKVFSHNLQDVLMAAPAGHKATIGLDPGFRTGVKVAVTDGTGKLLETTTIYPHQPQNQYEQAKHILASLVAKHQANLISIGNGTASRETERLVTDLAKQHADLNIIKLVVSEAGASVYSASSLAAEEFPDLDVSLRGAVSIARRLQDPLAELVKIEPKSIGVGQYQHDVNQTKLARALDASIEDCVNAVGVDVNTASSALLSRVSGLNSGLAKNIVTYRDQNGVFKTRQHLLKVPRLGNKAFEQCAGFLRISNGDNPLDSSAVHPEAYDIVKKIIEKTQREVSTLIADTKTLRKLQAKDFIDDKFGEPTVKDILLELEKPGRDPRPDFKTAGFKEGVEKISDLEPGMVLEGVISNVANFGAFVDIGVHQDGLVHISALSNEFVKNPRDVVKAGDIVKVKVLEVDTERKRIALTMQLSETNRSNPQKTSAPPSTRTPNNHSRGAKHSPQENPLSAMAEAFAKLKQ